MNAHHPPRKSRWETFGISLAVIAVIGMGVKRHWDNLEEKQRVETLKRGFKLPSTTPFPKAFQPIMTSEEDGTKPPSSTDVVRYSGRTMEVSHPAYFTALGGVPAYSRWSDAASHSYLELSLAKPGETVIPTEKIKNLIRNPAGGLVKVEFLPVDSRFKVEEVRRSSVPATTPQVICKVRSATNPGRDYFVHAAALKAP